VAVCALPAAGLALDAARGRLGAEPIETLTHTTGIWALRFLLLSLAVSPLRRALAWPALAPYRRSFGLVTFGYACLHVTTYVALDWGFDASAMLEDVVERPYVTAGATAFLCLVPLAATSTRATLRRLGARRWVRLHRLVYVAAGAAIVHFLWLVKADLREPILYGSVLAALLAARMLDVRVLRRRALQSTPTPGGSA
jgi:sulfoxide reductase heme-binding subunit YedZ